MVSLQLQLPDAFDFQLPVNSGPSGRAVPDRFFFYKFMHKMQRSTQING